MEMTFRRPANPRVEDRLRLHGSKQAYEKYGEVLEIAKLSVSSLGNSKA
jgi:hypothetical protein